MNLKCICRENARLLRLSAILESHPGKFRPNQPCTPPGPWAIFAVSLSKRSLYGGRMARRLQRIPDYFTEEEADALVNAAPSYPARMAFRIMLKTGLRVSEALALRRVDLRLDQHPPIIVVRADSPGNKGRRGREVPVPADLVESLRDLASSHSKNHYQPMLNLSRQRIGQVMKDAAREVGIDPAQGPPSRLPAHLRAKLRAAGGSDSRAAEMAGPRLDGRHPALCGAGRGASRMV